MYQFCHLMSVQCVTLINENNKIKISQEHKIFVAGWHFDANTATCPPPYLSHMCLFVLLTTPKQQPVRLQVCVCVCVNFACAIAGQWTSTWLTHMPHVHMISSILFSQMYFYAFFHPCYKHIL